MLIEVSNIFGTSFKLFLKHEGVNPTGTHKDRIGKRHVVNAFLLGMKKICAASCGNFGASLAYFARDYGLQTEIYVPKSFESPRVNELVELGAKIVRFDGTYEESVLESQQVAKEKGYYDANPGEHNRALEYCGYSSIWREILQDLKQLNLGTPTHLAIPVSNGVTLAGLYFETVLSSASVKFLAGSCVCNPIITSFVNKTAYRDLPQIFQSETETNEPLINWRSLDGSNAFNAIINSNGFAAGFEDQELEDLANFLDKNLSISSHPAGCAGLATVLKCSSLGLFGDNDVVVSLITSRRY
ncbi:MAG: pyridoxal-phosphate dependent enzyme [Deltaproteobacteria bacterium]|nr:pyridoxal-phosphate dependent enzyme [Deltaproteobacteria bacterium]